MARRQHLSSNGTTSDAPEKFPAGQGEQMTTRPQPRWIVDRGTEQGSIRRATAVVLNG